jgi:hypothetical protein
LRPQGKSVLVTSIEAMRQFSDDSPRAGTAPFGRND